MVGRLLRLNVVSRFQSQKMVFLAAKRSNDDLNVIGDLLKSGKVKPVIDKSYKLTEISEAIRYLETRHVRGKLVVTV